MQDIHYRVLIAFVLLSRAVCSGQQANWEDLTVDFAERIKELRATVGPSDPQRDRIPLIFSSADRFARAHRAEGIVTADTLSCAVHSNDYFVRMLAASSLTKLEDRRSADGILLELLCDDSLSPAAAYSLSYAPADIARPLLTKAVRRNATREAVRLLGVVGNDDDLKVLKEIEERKKTTRPATSSPNSHDAIAMIEFRRGLPEERRRGWQQEELAYFQAEGDMPGLHAVYMNYQTAAHWAHQRGARFSAEFLRPKLAINDPLATALAAEYRIPELLPELKRIAATHGNAALIAQAAVSPQKFPFTQPAR